ncbi:phage portal protein [Acidisoma cellulosilytica]|uniref:Phage portal protein n=1 Tax=Acidisoma cellulosilyticum TaxID=2802395 RepID=A0A963Z4N0_9PROT|nr:phage portal protein [Acidisoma cellulosilyticum]MCB8881693.1 phage portal protein [Acidisoma cellulosilyticum]
MDWHALISQHPKDSGLPDRCHRISALTSVLDGTLYNVIRHPFSMEMSDGGEYVPLHKRRPSVKSGLCRTVVDDSVALLFSEGHFPSFRGDEKAVEAIQAFVKASKLNEIMIDVATRGSVGSVAVLFQILKGVPYLKVMPTACLTPEWDPEAPDQLLRVTEKYKVRGRDLRLQGYNIPVDADAEKFWFQRCWDDQDETWFQPIPCSETERLPAVDSERSLTHGLGFLPVVWVKNLPGGDAVDGACTFEAAIDTVIEIDYQLSQAGRALRYAGDPRLMVRDAGGENRPITGGASNAIVLSDPAADAKFLEINGTAAAAVESYVRYLRHLALESIHGSRADPEKMSAAQSGRAIEMLNQGLIWLADRLRISYGEGALMAIARMLCLASSRVKGGLIIGGKAYRDLGADGLSLAWPRWYAPTAEDRRSEATTLGSLVNSGLMSHQTAVSVLAQTYDIEDIDAEMSLIAAEKAKALKQAQAAAATIAATEPLAG